ncbi:mannosyltransferase [Mariniflexile sp. AS56]|uniref:mannosyltransferase n=1 Tax=Mariniflexile sp. AS56 TaxID=3063957 RepID=UPI0026EC8731|nr:mannosyltransferase [Mariniflexile sp. AS56]MDO7170841.1 mannosyltransferase [Mariniflexile sp. AS56]
MPLNLSFIKLYRTPLLLVLSSIAFYLSFAYSLVRTDYVKLIMLYAALFFLFYKLVQVLKNQVVVLTWLAFIFRALFILATPNLSQDFYRFIWDGRMLLEGFNPYLNTVVSFISIGEFPVVQSQELHQGMGELNASHFTNYPPINQLCFAIAGLFAGKSILGSVMVMRLLIIAADFGTLFFGKKLLERLNLPAHNIFWYILNPFIIIELTSNLHFEGVMIFFLLWSLYLLYSQKWVFAAVVLGCSISVKLIPLMFLPLFFKWFMKKKEISQDAIASSKPIHNNGFLKLIAFYSITLLTTLLMFLPFYSKQFVSNYAKTVGLWFQDFEFNASLYYIARGIGYSFRGYNEIATIGKITPLLVVLFVLAMAFLRKNKTTVQIITSMLLALSFYYFTATTVHPWYVATLLILSVFTNYKFPLVWSFAIILSYLAYMNTNNTENLWIIGLEYAIVYSVFIWEVFLQKKFSNKHIDHLDNN